jgi:two-component system, NarL family, nitrate/nitrite response regulator NarL
LNLQLVLADDHSIVRDGIRALLTQEEGIHVKGEARNGNEVLELLSVVKVDLVLMDIDMPEMNGLEATRIIQKTYPSVKVIVLSMHDEKAMIQAMIAAGVDGYLLKNTPKAELVKAIYEVAQGHSYFPVEVKSRLLEKDSEAFRKGKLVDLTDREIEILTCIAEGLSNKEIGEKLFISHRTVDTHRTNLMQKLDVHNVAGLVRLAIQCGLVHD